MDEKETPVAVRMATLRDSDALLEIYTPYVLDTAISFELEPPTREEFQRRMESVLPRYPYLVCERAGEVLGYAYAAEHGARGAYRYTTCVSIYLRRDSHSQGLGSALYRPLLEILQVQGYCTCTAAIVPPNEKSVRLHQKHGFQMVGTIHKAGYKLGRWHDLLWMERALLVYEAAPGKIRLISQVDVGRILDKVNEER